MSGTHQAACAPDLALAERLFAELRDRTADGPGVTRVSYGPGEALAHDIVRREAERLGLTVETDAACNLFLTLPGAHDGPALVIGSHLDSVPVGGNYDGAAGVLMGLSALAGMVRAGVAPPLPVTVMAIRAEESAWFAASYIGSRAALGRLGAGELADVRRAGDGMTLGAAIDAAGGSAAEIAKGRPFRAPDTIAAFVEPHIEQGPILADAGLPLGLVTDIRGSLRHRHASCAGAFAHSGTTPRALRRDAVLAVATLAVELDACWARMADEGHDLTVTIGQIAADPALSSFSKVCGRVEFSLDMRSNSPGTLEAASRHLADLTARIARDRGVSFDLGPRSESRPAAMDPRVTAELERAAAAAGHPARRMACGAGHDAAAFAAEGVPAAMLFLRNENGSHNPDEHLDMADFRAGAEVLMRLCLGLDATAA